MAITRTGTKQKWAAGALIVALTYPALADQLVATFTGNGSQTTRPFTVSAPWEIQWDVGDTTAFYIYDDATGDPVSSAMQTGAGTGASYIREPGRYYVQVSGRGPWTVNIVLIE
ncbi:MAG: hypothetical protein KIS96_01545 [Bauldia sp.]|nr:hypothetical protein [Bauldia sp.]